MTLLSLDGAGQMALGTVSGASGGSQLRWSHTFMTRYLNIYQMIWNDGGGMTDGVGMKDGGMTEGGGMTDGGGKTQRQCCQSQWDRVKHLSTSV